jgi:hypothetical protein
MATDSGRIGCASRLNASCVVGDDGRLSPRLIIAGILVWWVLQRFATFLPRQARKQFDQPDQGIDRYQRWPRRRHPYACRQITHPGRKFTAMPRPFLQPYNVNAAAPGALSDRQLAAMQGVPGVFDPGRAKTVCRMKFVSAT